MLLGALLAYGLHKQSVYTTLHALLGYRWMSPALLFGLLLLIWALPVNLLGLPNFAIHVTMTAFLASILVSHDSVMAPILAWKPIYRIGETSYGIYLYHLIALDLARRILSAAGVSNDVLLTGLYVVLSIIMAEISFRTLEAWFRRFRGKVGR